MWQLQTQTIWVIFALLHIAHGCSWANSLFGWNSDALWWKHGDNMEYIKGRQNKEVCETEGCKDFASWVLKHMDPKEDPCHDFYKFACGRVLEDEGMVYELLKKNTHQLKSLVEEHIKPDEPAVYQTMKKVYKLCVDIDAMNARGLDPVKALIKEAGGWAVLGDWKEEGWDLMATKEQLQKMGLDQNTLFVIYISADAKDSSRSIIQVDQPNQILRREMMVNFKSNKDLLRYYWLMVDMAKNFGADEETAFKDMEDVVKLEMDIARITTPNEQRRDRNRMYNLYKLRDLQQEIPWLNWKSMLQSMAGDVIIEDDDLVNVDELDYIKGLGQLLKRVPKRVQANYIIWQAVFGISDFLTFEVRDARDYFRQEVLATYRTDRWKLCLFEWRDCASGGMNGLSMALQSLWVERFLNKSTKKAADKMADAIIQELQVNLKEVDWMDKQTREKALNKATKIVPHMAYPEEIEDIRNVEEYFKDLTLNEDHYMEAMMDLLKFSQKKSFKTIRQPYKKHNWENYACATQINGMYMPSENSITITGAFLQDPLFGADLPSYVNYATIGTVLAHECTHGLDDQGCNYDSDGNLVNWWDDKSKKKFKEKTKCIVDQFNGFNCSYTGLQLNGVNTQGENIADLGGLKLAYHAYRRQLTAPEPLLPGLTDYSRDQLFLLSYATGLCNKKPNEELKQYISYNVHAPAEWRVNGLLMNMPEFGKIFKCKKNARMIPKKRCKVW